MDLDFIGAGISDLVALDRTPGRYLEDFFLAADPHGFDIGELLARYTDREVKKPGFSVASSLWRGQEVGATATRRVRQETHMADLIGDEPNFGEIDLRTRVLLEKLGDHEVDLVLFDCHPGLGHVSQAVRKLADLNVLVTTPNRSDCFGLLKRARLLGLDDPSSMLLMNHAEPWLKDVRSLRRHVEKDALVGVPAKTLFPALQHLGRDERRYAAIPHSSKLKTMYYLGKQQHLPLFKTLSNEIEFCTKVFSLVLDGAENGS